MSRADRLLRLVQLLRRHRAPVSASMLATELAFFWDRVVARKIARDAGAQTEAFVRFAGRPS